ncbi:glycosyltransferase family 2 protein [Phocaeicola plebeius]|uniref:glycosyltransferase family 2 protein n=1 Tax=Phocaeicola plebeius TaxID=310297 RepID=UPI003AEF346B
MSKELITVVTVCFNAGQTIAKTMQSVLNQTYRPLEYILVDGKSTDNTLNIIYELEPLFQEKGIAVRIVSEKDKGIFDAMNKGVKLANGRWVNFMNAGDVFCNKDVITRLFSFDIDSDTKLVYGDTLRKKVYGIVPAKGNIPETILQLMPACHQSMFADTEEMRKYPFDLSYRLAADYHFVYNLYKRGKKLQYFPIDIALFDATEGATSTNKLEVKRECARIRGVEHTLKWRLYFLNKVFSYFVKRMVDSLIPNTYLMKIKKKNRERLQKR